MARQDEQQVGQAVEILQGFAVYRFSAGKSPQAALGPAADGAGHMCLCGGAGASGKDKFPQGGKLFVDGIQVLFQEKHLVFADDGAAGQRQFTAQIEQPMLNVCDLPFHWRVIQFHGQQSQSSVEFIQITQGLDAQAVLVHPAAIRQARLALVTRTGDDSGQAGHSALPVVADAQVAGAALGVVAAGELVVFIEGIFQFGEDLPVRVRPITGIEVHQSIAVQGDTAKVLAVAGVQQVSAEIPVFPGVIHAGVEAVPGPAQQAISCAAVLGVLPVAAQVQAQGFAAVVVTQFQAVDTHPGNILVVAAEWRCDQYPLDHVVDIVAVDRGAEFMAGCKLMPRAQFVGRGLFRFQPGVAAKAEAFIGAGNPEACCRAGEKAGTVSEVVAVVEAPGEMCARIFMIEMTDIGDEMMIAPQQVILRPGFPEIRILVIGRKTTFGGDVLIAALETQKQFVAGGQRQFVLPFELGTVCVHRVAALVLVDMVTHVGQLQDAGPDVRERRRPAQTAAAVEEILIEGIAEIIQVLVVALCLPVAGVEAVPAGIDARSQVEAGVFIATVDIRAFQCGKPVGALMGYRGAQTVVAFRMADTCITAPGIIAAAFQRASIAERLFSGLAGDDVDNTADGAGAPQGGAGAFVDLDAFDVLGIDMLQRGAAYAARIYRYTIDHDQILIAFRTADEQGCGLPGATVAADFQAAVKPQQVGYIGCRRALDFPGSDDFHACQCIIQ